MPGYRYKAWANVIHNCNTCNYIGYKKVKLRVKCPLSLKMGKIWSAKAVSCDGYPLCTSQRKT